MARLLTLGFDAGDSRAEIPGTPSASNYANAASARTGAYGARPSGSLFLVAGVTTVNVANYMRMYWRKSADPSVVGTSGIFWARGADSNNQFYVRLETDGTLTLRKMEAGVDSQIGSASAALSNNTWYRIEVYWKINSASTDECELRIDGVSVASTSTANIGTTNANFGWGTGGTGSTTDMDDVAVNDGTGSDQNTYPGEGQCSLLVPISDSQVGSWTGGAGGTTNLYLAVSNIPPVGTATETNTTQIENVDTSPDNSTDEYRANLTTYATAGIVAGDTINVLQPLVNHGEDAATGSKTGSFGLQSNPSQTYATFVYGDDSGSLGTFPSNWRTKQGNPVYSPSPTLSSSPVLAVRKTDTGSRVASVDFLGMYVDWVPTNFTPRYGYVNFVDPGVF